VKLFFRRPAEAVGNLKLGRPLRLRVPAAVMRHPALPHSLSLFLPPAPATSSSLSASNII
jgi:hypothetical protein